MDLSVNGVGAVTGGRGPFFCFTPSIHHQGEPLGAASQFGMRDLQAEVTEKLRMGF